MSLMTRDMVVDLIDDSTDSIALRLESHPIAGKKFSGLHDAAKDGWIAWTWLFDRLVDRGLDPAAAIALRAEAIGRQDAIGTHNAIAECLNSVGGLAPS